MNKALPVYFIFKGSIFNVVSASAYITEFPNCTIGSITLKILVK